MSNSAFTQIVSGNEPRLEYISNESDEDKNVKEIENQNQMMANSVEKVIINPDTLSSTKVSNSNTNNILNGITLPEDLVSQISHELSQSLVEDLENSIVNNIEEEEKEDNSDNELIIKECDIHLNDSVYPTVNNFSNNIENQKNDQYQKSTFRRKKKENSNSLFKKVVNGLRLSDHQEKTKTNSLANSSSSLETKPKSPPLGLSTLYSYSNPSLKILTGTTTTTSGTNGIKSPISPTISSPTIENAVISSPTKPVHSNSNPTLTSSSSFPFIPSLSFKLHNSSVDSVYSNNLNNNDIDVASIISTQSIQSLKDIKSKMDKKDTEIVKIKEKNKSKSVPSLNSDSINNISSKSTKGSIDKSSNSKIDIQSFINVFNNLSESYVSLNQNESIRNNSQGEIDNLSNSSLSFGNSDSQNNKNSISSQFNQGPSYMTSLPLLSNGNSYVVLPPLNNTNQHGQSNGENNHHHHHHPQDNNLDSTQLPPPVAPTKGDGKKENQTILTSFDSLPELHSSDQEVVTEEAKDNRSKALSTTKKHIQYDMDHSYLSRSVPNKTINYRIQKNISAISQEAPYMESPNTTSISSNSKGVNNSRHGSLDDTSSSFSSFMENSQINTIHEEGEGMEEEKVIINDNNKEEIINIIPTSTSVPSSNKKNSQNNNNDSDNTNSTNNNSNNNYNNNNIRRRKTIYTSTSYFNNKGKKQVNNNNKNNNNRSNTSANAKSFTNKILNNMSGMISNKDKIGSSRHYSISAPRSAFSNFLSNFSFTSTNSNSNSSNDSEEEEREREEEENFNNEYVDHSFIKSSASLFPSFINAEAEKKSNIKPGSSVFDSDFIEKVREKTINHRKSMFLTTSDPYEKNDYIEPSSYCSIIPEPEKLRLLNPIYVRAQYIESLTDPARRGKPLTLGEMEQEVVSPDQVLDTITAEKLRFHLPRRYRDYASWELIYSLSDHGSSFITLYDKIVDKGPLIMVIKDTQDQVFGAYIPESVHVSTRFYGSGECFLWTTKEDPTLSQSPSQSQSQSLFQPPTQYQNTDSLSSPTCRRPNYFKVYEWTGLNELNVLTSRDLIAFGGGKKGHFGLCIDQDINSGTTARCDTFRNEPLTFSSKSTTLYSQTVPTYYETPNISFECINLEFWKIVDDCR